MFTICHGIMSYFEHFKTKKKKNTENETNLTSIYAWRKNLLLY